MNLALIEADLERDEGYRQHPYKDTAGVVAVMGSITWPAP